MFFNSFIVGLILTIYASSSHADVVAGKSRADVACAVCHGQQGISSQANVPHLAGQPKFYLVEQLKNYRSGKRQHEIMSVIAKPLTDVEISNLSDWYDSIVIVVKDK